MVLRVVEGERISTQANSTREESLTFSQRSAAVVAEDRNWVAGTAMMSAGPEVALVTDCPTPRYTPCDTPPSSPAVVESELLPVPSPLSSNNGCCTEASLYLLLAELLDSPPFRVKVRVSCVALSKESFRVRPRFNCSKRVSRKNSPLRTPSGSMVPL